MPATVRVEHLQGSSPGTGAVVTQVRFRRDDLSLLDQDSPIFLPEDVRSTVSQTIAPSNSVQTVQVVSNVDLQVGEYLIVDPGTEVQEVVQITAIPAGGTTITALFKKAHSYGAFLQKTVASQSKVLRFNITSAPSGSISSIRLKRIKNLPSGVYDQYRAVTTYAEASTTPWISAPSVFYDRVPDEDFKVIDPGSYIVAGVATRMVEIQWLLTGSASAMDTTVYRVQWDET